MPTKVKEDEQTGLWDREIEDGEFEELIRDLRNDEEDELFQARVKGYRALRRQVKEKCDLHNLHSEERLRVGPYVVTGMERNGGGFNVPSWTSTIVGGITEL